MARTAGSLDANVVLRLLLSDVPAQHTATLKLFKGATGQFCVADTAIIEVIFVLGRAYEFTREQIVDAIEGLMMLRELNLNRTLFEKALPLYVSRTSLSFEDCCLAVYAELNDAEPLWTFDTKLARQAASAQLVTV